MNIGILTFHNTINYGAVLQTYALQKSLEKMGHNVRIIDYKNQRVAGNISKPYWRSYRNPFKYFNDTIIYNSNQVKRKKIITFSDNFIKKTMAANRDNIAEIAKEFELVFVGSDQVWNDGITANDDTYYLDFVPKEKRCSYAASIGGNKIPEENIPRVRKLLSGFKAISVREATAAEALKQQLDINSVRVLDPTLLLKSEEYINIAAKRLPESYVLLYMLIYSDTLLESAKKMARKMGVPVYCINSGEKCVSGVVDKSTAGIEEWLALFLNADFIFTNSFHGTAFSINFRRNFNVELPPAKINAGSRIADILKLFNIEDRIISNCGVNGNKIDFSEIESVISKERNASLEFIRQTINGKCISQDMTIDKSVISIPWDHCSGCGLCEKICPVNVINMQADCRGFKHPKIDVSRCIRCGKCLKECPYAKWETKSDKLKEAQTYAAYSKTPDIVRNSSSGGMFYELAKKMIQSGGIVYGAAFSKDFTLKHNRVEKLEDIKPLMGSKYMQSNAYLVFDCIAEDLKKGRKVLFVGTPCQVSALQSFCRDFNENLIAVDFVCHGVPSPDLIKEHIKYVEKYFNSKVAEYKPRFKIAGYKTHSKVAGWGRNELFIFENGKIDYSHPVTQAYKIIFYRDCSLRSSCYNCPFTTFERPGDLTIADYWGIEIKRPDLLHSEGTSMVMVNTQKGQMLLNSIDAVELYPTDGNTIVEKYQPHLFRPLRKPNIAERFWIDYKSKGWKFVAEKYAECDKSSVVKWRIKKFIRMAKSMMRKG